jgi:hypothetical protein
VARRTPAIQAGMINQRSQTIARPNHRQSP